jgi:anti-sigma factor RsiW
MTVTVTLPAPPEPYRGAGQLPTTPDTLPGTGRPPRVVVMGSVFGGLTATKALKHAQLNITDVVVFLTRITAQGTSHVVNPTPFWVQVIPAATAVTTTIGMLIALYVAVVRELKSAAEEYRHHKTQTDALHQAELQRVTAQARFRWIVRSDNTSNAVTTILADVKAQAANGIEVTCCRQANNTMPVDQWQRTGTGQPKRTDKQPLMVASADHVVTARDSKCHRRLPRLPRTSKGWS